MTDILFFRIRQHALDCRNIQRRRHVIHNRIQESLHTLVAIRCSTENRNDFHVADSFTQSSFELINRNFFLHQICFHQILICLTDGIQHLLAVFLRLFPHILRDFGLGDVLTQIVIIDVSLHIEQVDDAFEGILRANRQLHRNRIGSKTVFHHLHGIEKVGAHDIHLIDECHTRDIIRISLTPYVFRLRFYAALCTEDADSAIQHTQGALYFNSKVYMTRSVDDVDSVILPEASGRSGGDGNTTLLFLLHPVHLGGSLMGITDLMGLSGIIQDTLG